MTPTTVGEALWTASALDGPDGALGAGVVGRGADVQIWADRPAAPRDATA